MRRRGRLRALSRFWRDCAGAVAASYTLALPALVAVSAVGFDYARMASLDTELQNAADQATLAAATQLDKAAGAQNRAIDAASNLVSNDTRFANDNRGLAVAVAEVMFFENAADAEEGTNGFNNPSDPAFDGRAAFVRVIVATRTANYALTPIVGAISDDIANAQAVAGVGSALCRTPPLMMCNPAEPEGNSNAGLDFDANAHIGQGFIAKQGGGSSWGPGNYGWLDTGLGTGADAVREGIGWNSNPGGCIAQNGVATIDTQPGNIANAPQAMNTRFDIYGWCESGGPCSPSINSRKDVVRPADASSGQGCQLHGSGWQEAAVPKGSGVDRTAYLYLPDTKDAYPVTKTPVAMGHPRDACHATASNTCGGDGIFGDAFWDRDAYFRSHYLRTTAGAGGAVGTRWSAAQWRANLLANGFTGAIDPAGTTRPTRPTRYEVYKWEIDKRGQMIDGVEILGPSPPGKTDGTLVNHGTPICGPQQTPSYAPQIPAANVADRRRISVAVVNCEAHNVRGNMSGVPVRRWMDVFLVQPSLARDRTAQDEIYVEIIGETAAGSSGETAGTVIRRDMPFLMR